MTAQALFCPAFGLLCTLLFLFAIELFFCDASLFLFFSFRKNLTRLKFFIV